MSYIERLTSTVKYFLNTYSRLLNYMTSAFKLCKFFKASPKTKATSTVESI